ncbi:MAG: hypothetical protein IKR04_04970 [Clostridia bacterium]|nr:hypothetical protein [Clostridia bacterium]
MNHGNSNGYYVELASHFHGDNLYWRRVANGTAYNWKKVAWTDSNITGNAATATNADKVDGYHSSDLWRKDGGTWNPGANIALGATANNQEWSFDITRNGYTGTYWHVWDSSLNSMLKVTADDGKVRAPYGFVGNLTGNADTATTAAALSSDAGSATVPVYFTNGKPTTCSTTLGVSITGNAATATKLAIARTINGTSFDGSANITTANWGTARNISISDSDSTNTGTAVSVNGSAAVTLNLPATIKASLTGNADTATKATQDSDGNQINTTYTKKSELLDLVYPIGAIYISVVNTSPATLFGGTWE